MIRPVRYVGRAFRAHAPQHSHQPLSGFGAQKLGGRFNPPGMPALYLSKTPEITLREVSHGFTERLDPSLVVEYDLDVSDVVDLTGIFSRFRAGVTRSQLGCRWLDLHTIGMVPPSWVIAQKLYSQGYAGVIVPSFATGSRRRDKNIVLWRWGATTPYKVSCYDPKGRIPKNNLSWK